MLAIRDDDTSYWTRPEEINYVYGNFLKNGMKLSLAVVPESYKLVYPGDRKKFYLIQEKHFIYENKALVDFLKFYVNKGQLEIMLHGYDHSYFVKDGEETVFLSKKIRNKIGETIPGILLPECIYKDDIQIKKELTKGKKILEDTFHTEIKTFVPPSNALRAGVVREAAGLGMDISGTITNRFNRKIDIYSLNVFMKKALWKIRGEKISYPYIMKYKSHKELGGHAFTPSIDLKKYSQEFRRCHELGCDFTVATHYWELIENEDLRSEFNKFLDYALHIENVVCLRELFEEKRKLYV